MTLNYCLKHFEYLKNSPVAESIRADLKSIAGIRGRNPARNLKAEQISIRVYDFLKQNGVKRITKTLIEFCFFDNTFENYGKFALLSNAERMTEYQKLHKQKQRLKARIMANLENAGKVAKHENAQAVYTYILKPLYSFDYGSFKAMMQKNGYKRRAFIQDGNKRVLVNSNMDIDIFDYGKVPTKYTSIDFDSIKMCMPEVVTEIYSNMPKESQKVTTKNKFSIVLSKKGNLQKSYNLI